MAIEINPYKEGDYFKIEGSDVQHYKGPIYDVIYPIKFNDMQELADWIGLGYNFERSFSNDDGTFTIRIRGDIPDELQQGLEKVGVKTQLVRSRMKDITSTISF